MYRFKQIKARYSFVSEVIKPSGECSMYSKEEMVEVLPNLVEGLNFTLRGASHELIDGVEVKDFDLIMSRLGQSLYPIELNVLKTGEIKRLKNFEDIQSRWNRKSKDVLQTNKNAYWVERYINMTSKNIRNEEHFMNALSRNNFIQLLFIDEATQKQRMVLSDFPFTGSNIDTEYNLVSSQHGCYCYSTEIDKVDDRIRFVYGDITVSYTEKGLPKYVSVYCTAEVVNEGFYRKRMTMKLIDVK